MNLFNNILLLTGNELKVSVLRQTMAMTDKNGADLKLMQISHPIFDRSHRQIGPHRVPNTGSILDHYSLKKSDLYNVFNRLNMRVQSKVIRGDTVQSVNKEIKRDHHDLIVVDSSHNDVLQSHKLTQSAMHLLRQCPIPVLVSRPEKEARQVQIMAAIDPSDSSNDSGAPGNALNEKIMALANDIALKTKQNMHVVNCWRHPMAERMRNNKNLSVDEIHKFLLEARAQQKRRLTQFLNQNTHQQVNYRVHIRHGSPETQIPAVSRDHHIDLIVLGSVGRSGLDGLMIGNTAENIVCNTNLSVLVVKPNGYQPVSINAITPAEAACEL